MSKLEFNWLSPGRILCRIDGEDFFAEKIYVDDHVLASVSGEYEIKSSYTLHDGVLKAYTPKESDEFKDRSEMEKSVEGLKCLKPAMEVKPCHVVVYGRIGELADGIKRQLSSDKPDTDLIKRWAVEIACQCDVISYDKIFEDKKMK